MVGIVIDICTNSQLKNGEAQAGVTYILTTTLNILSVGLFTIQMPVATSAVVSPLLVSPWNIGNMADHFRTNHKRQYLAANTRI
ncbi:MAG: hypothetical protein ACK56F_04230 [bacterium]